jgi:DNA-binding transcriptional LysR family regulator
MIEIRHLRYFIAVAEELHFGRAAERLNMSQPPLSQQIKKLEERLGFQLFHRTKRRVQLTAPGHVFLSESRQVLDRLERAIRTGQQASRGEHGALAVGFVSSAIYSALPSILRRFRQLLPEVDVSLRELSAGQQKNWLENNRLDIGIVRSRFENPDLEYVTILEEPFIIVLPENHKQSKERAISLHTLSREPFILFPRSLAPGLYDQIINLCQQARFSPRVVQEAIQMQTIVGLVAAEIGVAIVPQSLQNLQRPGVVYKPLKGSAPKTTISLVYRKNDPSPVVQRFLNVAMGSID